MLDGQVAVVTGGGSGMGRAIARALADAGCRVVAVGRTEEKLKETVEGHTTTTGSLTYWAADVASRDHVSGVVKWVQDKFGPIDILVNNAGVNVRDRQVANLSLDDWEYLLQVNLTGAFQMIHTILPSMRERKRGLIINISSIAGLRPSPLGGAAYSASKFGLNALSGVVSLEEADHNIRSTVICPGEVETPILDERPEPVSAERRARMLQPEDVAEAVLFIARLHPRAHVPELVIKPTAQAFA